MNKEITIIELLNKIANNEEVPKKIRYDGNDYYFCNHCGTYEVIESSELCGKDLYDLLDDLNDKVEIIEEDKKIEKLDNRYYDEVNECYGGKKELGEDILIDKINELIDEINYIRSNK